MWCVIYAGDKNEQKTKAFVSHLLQGNIPARCFSLTRNRLYKNGGVWHTVNERFLPGYVFIETDEPEMVYKKLEETSKSLLFSDSRKVSVMDSDEAALLELITDSSGTVGLSDVSIGEDKKVTYLSGPLAKVSERVKKVNLHNRFAEIDMNFSGRRETLRLGIRF